MAVTKKFLTARQAERSNYIARGREILDLLIFRDGKTTIDEVRRLNPLPKGLEPTALTAITAGQGYNVVGYVNSNRPEAKSRRIAEFAF